MVENKQYKNRKEKISNSASIHYELKGISPFLSNTIVGYMSSIFIGEIFMYKLLVVDDEPRQVRALANIINQLRPDYEVLTACDGQEALNLLSDHTVNILFTDIRMPAVDGLQLIERLSERKIPLKTVILSGYGEFEYAQKAIQFGVNQYLVKPISKTDLESILEKVECDLEDERCARLQEEELKKKLDHSLPVYLDYQLNRWITGRTNGEEVREIRSIFPYQTYGLVLITAFKKPQAFLEDLNLEFVQYAKFSMKETLNTFGHSISFLPESDKRQIVTVVVSNSPLNHRSQDVLKKMDRYIANIKEEYGLIATLGVGDKTEDIFRDIEKAFQSARAAIERRFFCGLGQVIYSTDGSCQSDLVPYEFSPIENEILEAVRLKDKIRVCKITGTAFDKVKKCAVNPVRLKEDVAYLLLNQAKNVSWIMEDKDYAILSTEIKRKSLQCEEHRELWHFANETLCRMIDISHEKFSDKNGILIGKCKSFIEERYMEDISLESVAQKYFYNPSYFSNLFKSYMGLGFSEYLLKVRIQNAKKLLKATEASMAEVAGRVGFKDPAYFNRVFKKEVGISPLKYRQMNENR